MVVHPRPEHPLVDVLEQPALPVAATPTKTRKIMLQ
uniref:Uncharacterized protein n=1 Tax=Arundo donax TaxID=35708 RepID=A0A0A8YW94_ARUDO